MSITNIRSEYLPNQGATNITLLIEHNTNITTDITNITTDNTNITTDSTWQSQKVRTLKFDILT